ncbi:hotdog fold thioesterase [bacterium]|nr:hotdog fold thioesterase [bacterium]
MAVEKIWKLNPSIEIFNERSANTAVTHMGIEAIEVGPDFLRARMPVDERTKQPIGLLNGGSSVLLAESLMSTAGNWCVDFPNEFCVGQEINANHLRSARDGFVEGVARPIHLGRTSHVWECRITHEDKLVCISRMTLAVLQKKK